MAKRPEQASKRRHPFSDLAIIDNHIKGLRRIEEACFGPRHKKTDFYRYLRAVLKQYLRWKDDNVEKKIKGELSDLYPKRVKICRGTHTIRSIIDASSKQDEQTRSRWTLALEYAVVKRAEVDKIGLAAFCAQNGGVAGCARKMAAIRRKRKRQGKPVRA